MTENGIKVDEYAQRLWILVENKILIILSGILYFVPHTVGNLEDMTFRAVNVLKEVDYILCEDTRTSGILLKHFEISKPLKSYHLHNEHQATEKVITDLKMVRISLLLLMGTRYFRSRIFAGQSRSR